MMRRFLACGVLVIMLALLACSGLRPKPGESRGTRVDHKVVMAKREPNLLIATDRAECTVSRDRWERARIGERFLCAWQRGW